MFHDVFLYFAEPSGQSTLTLRTPMNLRLS